MIVPDQVGFGKSSKPEHFQYTFQTLATHTASLLDALGVERAAVVGHSMGGMLATRFALMFPERVTRLVLVNPIGLEDWKRVVPYRTVDAQFESELKSTPESIRRYMQDAYFAGEWKPAYEPLVEILAGWTQGPDRERIAWTAALTSDMVFTQPVLDEFPDLVPPTLLIIGQRDRTAIGRAWAPAAVKDTLGDYPVLGRRAAAAIPGSELVELEGVGHMPQVEAFDAYAEALLGFLAAGRLMRRTAAPVQRCRRDRPRADIAANGGARLRGFSVTLQAPPPGRALPWGMTVAAPLWVVMLALQAQPVGSVGRRRLPARDLGRGPEARRADRRAWRGWPARPRPRRTWSGRLSPACSAIRSSSFSRATSPIRIPTCKGSYTQLSVRLPLSLSGLAQAQTPGRAGRDPRPGHRGAAALAHPPAGDGSGLAEAVVRAVHPGVRAHRGVPGRRLPQQGGGSPGAGRDDPPGGCGGARTYAAEASSSTWTWKVSSSPPAWSLARLLGLPAQPAVRAEGPPPPLLADPTPGEEDRLTAAAERTRSRP